jgi:hypothetical protein
MAYEADEVIIAIRPEHEVGQQQVSNVDTQAERERQQGDQHGLEQQRHHVAQGPAEQQGQPAHRRDPGPFDHSGPELGDEAEALEQPAEDGQQHQQAGHEDAVRVGVGGGAHRRQRRLEQGREQQQVHDGLEHPDEQPYRLAQQEQELTLEDQPGVTSKLHGSLLRLRTRAASGRSW